MGTTFVVHYCTVKHAVQAPWVREEEQENGILRKTKLLDTNLLLRIEASSTTESSSYLEDNSIDTQ
jgi:hypothetical protein